MEALLCEVAKLDNSVNIQGNFSSTSVCHVNERMSGIPTTHGKILVLSFGYRLTIIFYRELEFSGSSKDIMEGNVIV
jgi:hypothetical protein